MNAKCIYVFIFGVALLYACGNAKEQTSDTTPPPTEETTTTENTVTEEVENSNEVTPNTGALIFLQAYDGKYIHDVNLFENPNLKPRLTKLLGNDFKIFDANMQVSVPMKLDMGNNVLFVSGLAPRSGGLNEASLAIDIQNDAISIIIMQDRNLKTYQEKSQLAMPSALAEWKQDKIKIDEASE